MVSLLLHRGYGQEIHSHFHSPVGSPNRAVGSAPQMPGGNGFDLAERIAERWPGIKILFVSGLTSDCGTRRRLCGRPMLQKPFTRDALTKKVHELLSAALSRN